jgi:hypothetical protein
MRDKSSEKLLKQEKEKEGERDDEDIYKNRRNDRAFHLFFLKRVAEVKETATDDQEEYEGGQKDVGWRLSEVPD